MINLQESLRGQLIVSCQAAADEPMHGPQFMAAMARAAQMGGAQGIRANGPEDIAAIKASVSLPIIGIQKRKYTDSDVYITPTFEDAQTIVEAGSDFVALDATPRSRPNGERLDEMVRRIHEELGVPVMADLSSVEDARFAVEAGVDWLGTTLSGYTPHGRPALPGPDLEFIDALVREFDLPVVAEGRFSEPEQVVEAFQRGAFAVVVGTAITRPQDITRCFTNSLHTYSR